MQGAGISRSSYVTFSCKRESPEERPASNRLMKKDFEGEHHAKSILLWRSPEKIDSADGEMRLEVCVGMSCDPAVSDFFNSLLTDRNRADTPADGLPPLTLERHGHGRNAVP